MRDTDTDWRLMGDADPYFGVLSEERYRGANLNDEAIEDFYAGGVGDVAFVVEQLRRRWPDFAPRTAVDFGCGVGRLTLAIAGMGVEVTGIDIAPGMLRVAEERTRSTGAAANFSTELPATADWIMSHIVFQHIPPRRGLAILEQLLALTPVGGFVSLYFALHRRAENVGQLAAGLVRWDGETMASVGGDPGGEARMFDYDGGAVIARLFAAGFLDPQLLAVDHGGHIGSWFIARRHAVGVGCSG